MFYRLISILFYWLGCFFSYLTFDLRWFNFYTAYNWCMIKSDEFDKDDNIWRKDAK